MVQTPAAAAGVCTWCGEEQRLTPVELARQRGGGAIATEDIYRLLLPGGG